MTLAVPEFLRRFSLHILPPRFVKIRSYGLLSNRGRSERIEQVRALLPQAESKGQDPPSNPVVDKAPVPQVVCPFCGSANVVLIAVVDRPRQPTGWDSS
jgi:hypothetical protein